RRRHLCRHGDRRILQLRGRPHLYGAVRAAGKLARRRERRPPPVNRAVGVFAWSFWRTAPRRDHPLGGRRRLKERGEREPPPPAWPAIGGFPVARKTPVKSSTNDKIKALEPGRESGAGEALTTNHGTRINDNQNSLKAGARGPSLLEDFILREKITHFDHERIPERVVHARGAAAHGYFQVAKWLARWTKAKFLQDPAKKTPVFVRFSTVAGSRGSSDLARDVRGFAVKFYTEEGNFDLVGN